MDAVEGSGKLVRQFGVVGDECGEGLAIRSGGGGEVGEGLGCIVVLGVLVVLDGCIRMVSRGSGGLLLLAKETLGIQEVAFELDPGLVGRVLAVPRLAIVEEYASVEHESEGSIDDLLVGHGLVTGVGHLGTFFDLVDEHLEWGVGVPWMIHAGVVGLHFGCCELSVVREEVR